MAEEPSGISVEARVLNLDDGVYAVSIRKIAEVVTQRCGILLPAVHISLAPSNHPHDAEIIAANSGWLGCGGGTVVVRAPLGGAAVLITCYTPSDRPSNPCEAAIRRIDRQAPVYNTAAEAAVMAPTRNIPIEVLLHIERAGDRRISAEGWIGNLGKKLRLEAFSIRPLETLAPGDLEYKAYGPNGRETPWVSNSKLCGTRGLGLPLTGFAIRLAAHLGDRFGAEYYGAFFESGVCGPIRDGAPCMGQITDRHDWGPPYRLGAS